MLCYAASNLTLYSADCQWYLTDRLQHRGLLLYIRNGSPLFHLTLQRGRLRAPSGSLVNQILFAMELCLCTYAVPKHNSSYKTKQSLVHDSENKTNFEISKLLLCFQQKYVIMIPSITLTRGMSERMVFKWQSATKSYGTYCLIGI